MTIMLEKQKLSSLSRRDLLSTAGLTIAGSTLAHGANAPGETRRPHAKNMQLSMAAYSRRDDLTSGKMDLFQFIDWCADLDLAGTELTSYYFKKNFDASYLHELRHRAFSKGVTVSGTAIRNNFCMPPGPQKDKEIAQVKQWIDYAAELCAPHIRIFGGDLPKGGDKAAGLQWVADGIKAVLPHAAEKGIVLGLENHGGITLQVEDHLAICDKVGQNPYFGINWDSGGYQTNAYEALAKAAPRAVNVQMKVSIAGPGGKDEPIDFGRIRDILEKAGYKGWIALEYEAKENPLQGIPKAIAQLKQAFGIS